MNNLEKYFNQNQGRLINKWLHYFEIYDSHFKKYRNTEVTILEIGVSQGGSLQMWKNYFGDKAKIYGIDINPKCKTLEEDNIQIFIGSQSDKSFLREVKSKIPAIDILIDDGGHSMKQQIVSFEELFDKIKDDGVYLCEDIHTSYWLEYGGGYKRKSTFIEYSKYFIDFLNAYHSTQSRLKVNSFTKSVNSLHYYDSILVIEKRKREAPTHRTTGQMSFELESNHKNKIYLRIRYIWIETVNKILRFFNLGGYIWK